MNNRQARLFAIGSTLVAAFVFLALTVDSHRQFPELTNAENISPEVSHGMDVWHENNCINCHTLFGEGAYYAPDLTKIAKHRSDPYLMAYMKDPSRFYDEQTHRRLMPKQNLSEEEISDLIAFLEWVSNVDNQGWPPRPIRVVGSFQAGGEAAGGPVPTAEKPVTEGDDPRALGRKVFRTAQPGCPSCHSTQPGADMAGPTLAGIATRAERIVESPDYTGDAETAEGYIRESIVEPGVHLVPGDMYSSGGTSFMPARYGETLSEEQIDHLVAYLTTFE